MKEENKLKPSKYNIFVEDNDSSLLIFNTLSKKTISVGVLNKTRIKESLDSGELSGLSDNEIQLLEEAGVLVKTLEDEHCTAIFEYNKKVYDNSELNLVIIPTKNCNFRCVYCPQSHESREMDEVTQQSVIKFIEKNASKYHKVFIEWFGGEPLLKKKEIVRMMQQIKSICNKHKTILISSMTTNGYELDLETFENLVENRVMFYQISIDGSRETHNKSRPHQSNSDSFEKIMSNLKRIKEYSHHKHFVIGVRINVSPQNMNQIDPLIQYYDETFNKDDRFQLMWQWVRDWGGNIEQSAIRQTHKGTEDMCKEFYQMCLEKGIKCVDYMSCKSGLALCEACKLHGYVISYDGNIYKCAMLLDNEDIKADNLVGKLLPNGQMKLFVGKLAKWIVPKSSDTHCKNCVYYPICMGFPCPLSLNFREKKICIVDKKLSDTHIRNIRLHQTTIQL